MNVHLWWFCHIVCVCVRVRVCARKCVCTKTSAHGVHVYSMTLSLKVDW